MNWKMNDSAAAPVRRLNQKGTRNVSLGCDPMAPLEVRSERRKGKISEPFVASGGEPAPLKAEAVCDRLMVPAADDWGAFYVQRRIAIVETRN